MLSMVTGTPLFTSSVKIRRSASVWSAKMCIRDKFDIGTQEKIQSSHTALTEGACRQQGGTPSPLRQDQTRVAAPLEQKSGPVTHIQDGEGSHAPHQDVYKRQARRLWISSLMTRRSTTISMVCFLFFSSLIGSDRS